MAKTVKHDGLKALWGDQDYLEVSQQKTFSEMIFEALSERIPNSEELKIFDLILNLSIDHGPDTPSAVATLKKAEDGGTISKSVAAGIEQINDVHGGAIEPLMKLLYRIREMKQGGCDLGLAMLDIVNEYLKEDKKIPGFGHRIYKDKDPRAELIIKKLNEFKLGQEFPEIIFVLEGTIKMKIEKNIPLNIDGAIAVALCSMGFDSKVGKAFFIIARTPGLCAQYLNNS